jgi:hypothetical protein
MSKTDFFITMQSKLLGHILHVIWWEIWILTKLGEMLFLGERERERERERQSSLKCERGRKMEVKLVFA